MSGRGNIQANDEATYSCTFTRASEPGSQFDRR
jgi:hypothetical protein